MDIKRFKRADQIKDGAKSPRPMSAMPHEGEIKVGWDPDSKELLHGVVLQYRDGAWHKLSEEPQPEPGLCEPAGTEIKWPEGAKVEALPQEPLSTAQSVSEAITIQKGDDGRWHEVKREPYRYEVSVDLSPDPADELPGVPSDDYTEPNPIKFAHPETVGTDGSFVSPDYKKREPFDALDKALKLMSQLHEAYDAGYAAAGRDMAKANRGSIPLPFSGTGYLVCPECREEFNTRLLGHPTARHYYRGHYALVHLLGLP